MATATSLLGAITNRFDTVFSSTRETDFTSAGGLWVGEIPEDKVNILPLVCLVHHDEVPDYTFEDDFLEEGSFSFFIYATGLAAAEVIAQKIKDAFDLPGSDQANDKLKILNARVISCTRLGYQVRPAPFRPSTGQLVTEIEIPYKTMVRKTLNLIY